MRKVRTLPRGFVALSALAGFPRRAALLIHLATTSSIHRRALTEVDWIWPFTVVLSPFRRCMPRCAGW